MDTGLVLLPSSLIMALAMPIAGKIYPRVGAKWMTVSGLVLIIIGSYEMTQLHSDSSNFYIIFWMAVRNLGVVVRRRGDEHGRHGGDRAVHGRPRVLGDELGPQRRRVVRDRVVHVAAGFPYADACRGLGASRGNTPAVIQLLSFTMSVNDVFLIATFIAVAAIPFTLLIRKKRDTAKTEAVAA